MNKLLLYLIMLPKGLWRTLGADVPQLKAILSVKLKMDDRKPLGMGRQRDNTKRKSKFTSTLTFFLNFIVGVMYIFPMIAFKDPYMALFGLYTMLMVLFTFGLITDFSNVLIDTRDKLIIFPKPVNDRTIFLSRMLHIFIYFIRSIFPMSLAPWITWGIMNGWKAAVWFPVPMLLLSFMCLFFVLGVYLLLLRLAKPERFKDIIGYFQIVFSILLFTTYYFMPRIADSNMLINFSIENVAWIRFTPSYWLASCWYWIEPGKALLAGTPWFSIVAVILPFIMLWVTVKFFAPSFMRKISAIDGVEVEAPKKKIKNGGKGSLYLRLSLLVNRNVAARAGFSLAWLQTARSRTFKMRVYPSFAYVFVYFFYMVMNTGVPMGQVMEKLEGTKAYLFLLYMTAFILLNAVSNMNMTEQYKASWIYYSSPLETPGRVMGGAFKAMWLKFYFPFMAVVSIFTLYIWGTAIIPDIILATVNVTAYVLILMYINNRYLPFSIPEQMKSGAGKTVLRMLFAIVFMGGMGAAHYFIYFLWLKIILILLSVAFLWTIWDSYINTDWKKVRMAEDAL